jgi:AraC-like DNA-binding protein
MYKHLFPACDITYIIKGNAQYIIDETTYNLGPGDLLYLPAGCVRSAITYPDRLMQCFSVNFNLKSLEGGGAVNLPLPTVTHLGHRNDLISYFHELAFTWTDQYPGYTLKTTGIFLLILSRLLELAVYNIDSEAGDYRIRKVTRYITKHYAENLSVKKMAALAGLDSDYFGALFKRETGNTLNQYLIKTRIRNAENMLRSGEYSQIGKVAEQCGYADVYYFSKQFKAVMGIPPSKCIPKRDN